MINMTNNEERFELHLSELWSDRINLAMQSSSHEAFGRKIEIISYEMDELISQRKRCLAEIDDLNSQRLRCQAEIELLNSQKIRCEAELEKQQQFVSLLGSEVMAAQREITRLLSEPWHAPLEFTARLVAEFLSLLARPFSSSLCAYFTRAASARKPERFQVGLTRIKTY